MTEKTPDELTEIVELEDEIEANEDPEEYEPEEEVSGETGTVYESGTEAGGEPAATPHDAEAEAQVEEGAP